MQPDTRNLEQDRLRVNWLHNVRTTHQLPMLGGKNMSPATLPLEKVCNSGSHLMAQCRQCTAQLKDKMHISHMPHTSSPCIMGQIPKRVGELAQGRRHQHQHLQQLICRHGTCQGQHIWPSPHSLKTKTPLVNITYGMAGSVFGGENTSSGNNFDQENLVSAGPWKSSRSCGMWPGTCGINVMKHSMNWLSTGKPF